MIRRSFENKSMIATMAVVETNKHISSSSFCPPNKRCLDGATNHYNRLNKVSTMTKMENANISNYGWKSTILFMAISISIIRCICHCWAKSHSNWTTAINNLWHEMCILQITFYLTNQMFANNALSILRNKRKIDYSFELMPVQIINSKANNCFSEWMWTILSGNKLWSWFWFLWLFNGKKEFDFNTYASANRKSSMWNLGS